MKVVRGVHKKWTTQNFNVTKYLTAVAYRTLNQGIDEGQEKKGTDRFKYLWFTVSNQGTTEDDITKTGYSK